MLQKRSPDLQRNRKTKYRALIDNNVKENYSIGIENKRAQSNNVGLDDEIISCKMNTNEPGNMSIVSERHSPYHIPKVETDIEVETMHISCHSDTYKPGHNYAGVIIYQYDGQTEWRTANNTHCKSGYIVIQDTDREDVKGLKKRERVDVHEAVYKNAFGEAVKAGVVGEGFALSKHGKFKNKTKSFNKPKGSDYHDNRNRMNELTEHCVKKIVQQWRAGECVQHRNFIVKELLGDYATKDTGRCCSCCYIFSKMISR